MRLFKLYLFVLILISTSGYAQEQKPDYNAYAPKKFLSRIEIYAGPSFLFPRVDSAYWGIDLERKIGHIIGLGLSLPINRNFEINTKFFRERNGFKGSYGVTFIADNPSSKISGREIFDVSNDYSTISLLSQISPGRKQRINFGFGGFVSYLTKSKVRLNYIEGDPVPDQANIRTSQFNRYDAGISFSLKYGIPLNKNVQLNLQLLNNYGLRNILKKDTYNESPLHYYNSSDIKNNNISFSIGINGMLYKPELKNQRNANNIKFYQRSFFSKFEILGGPSVSFLRGNEAVENTTLFSRKLKSSNVYGLGLTHQIDDNYEAEILFLLERKGGISIGKTTYFDMDSQTMKQGKIKSDYDYKYLTLPALINYAFGKKRQFTFGMGPYISHLHKQNTCKNSIIQ